MSGIAVCSFVLLLAVAASRTKQAGWPIILVPGDGGSQLEAKLTGKPAVVHSWCSRTTADYFSLWLNFELFTPIAVACFADNMRLVYDNVSQTTTNSRGVLIRVPGFGNTSTVEVLDSNEKWLTDYFKTFVDQFVSWGYRRSKDVRGAPYDFRKAPNEFGDLYKRLKALVENTYYRNGKGNRKVVLIAHSMGVPTVAYFLNLMSQPWKDKFVRSFVCLSGPLGGSSKIMKLFASGYNLDLWPRVLEPIKLRPFQRTMTSSSFLIPTSDYWKDDEPLVITEKKNYTVTNYKEFFDDIGFPTGWDMFKATSPILKNIRPPNVEVHCLYGIGMPTPETYVYGKGQFPDGLPKQFNGDGDGTVNLRSLQGCEKWAGGQKQAVHGKTFDRADHLAILYRKDVIQYLKEHVLYST